MPKAYVIFQETITDREGIKAYGAAAAKASGAKPIAFTPAAEVLEGEWPADQTVVLEFESVEAAKAWYNSPEYQAAVPLRQKAANTNVAIIPGL